MVYSKNVRDQMHVLAYLEARLTETMVLEKIYMNEDERPESYVQVCVTITT